MERRRTQRDMPFACRLRVTAHDCSLEGEQRCAWLHIVLIICQCLVMHVCMQFTSNLGAAVCHACMYACMCAQLAEWGVEWKRSKGKKGMAVEALKALMPITACNEQQKRKQSASSLETCIQASAQATGMYTRHGSARWRAWALELCFFSPDSRRSPL
jgi:hypothetical protein